MVARCWLQSHRDPTGAAAIPLPAGSCFGEASLLDGLPHPWSVEADGPCRLLAIHRQDLLNMARRSPAPLLELVRSLSTLAAEA